jgi:peptidoglycan-N-acetylglucosamine deacetylase
MASPRPGRPAWRARLRRLFVTFVWPLPIGAVVMLLQPLWLVDLLARAETRILWRVDTDQPLAALTFDDGPDPVFTPRILDHLAHAGAKATFFMVGERARQHPTLVERVRREGHEVANHSQGLEHTVHQPLAAFQESVLEAERALGLESIQPRFFRPASGLIRPEQLGWLAGHGYVCALGSAYPYDAARPPVSYMVWLVRKNLAPGTIVVLHDAGERERTVAAVPKILDAGRERGLSFVTLSELWARRKR